MHQGNPLVFLHKHINGTMLIIEGIVIIIYNYNNCDNNSNNNNYNHRCVNITRFEQVFWCQGKTTHTLLD